MRKHKFPVIPTAPPAFLLIARQFGIGGDWVEIRKRIRGMISDLREQSFGFEMENIKRSDRNDLTSFDIHLHGALDLLSGQGCQAADCRIAAAKRLARSVGLIADRVWLTDYLSGEVYQMGRPTNAALDSIMAHTLTLIPLLPLIEAGIVMFRSPWVGTCRECSQGFEDRVDETAHEVLKVFGREFKVEPMKSGGFFVKTGQAFEPSLYLHSPKSIVGDLPKARSYAAQIIRREVKEILWVGREASLTRGSIFTNSRLGLAGLLEQEGRLLTRKEMIMFDNDRTLEIPWVSDLNASQILQLREEASGALPLFRERIARALVRARGQDARENSEDVLAELRAQAAEVRSELTVKQSKSARYWKTTYGLLGLGISAYGVATDQVMPGVAGLLPILQLLIGHRTGHEAESERLKTRPGYVMVKAQDILAHDH
ncbi:MAG: hypothetical protein HY014_06840 [Acidobacteria bacterium]|nr:hypothetical protein [Acidobacteriota bacterium]MBI3487867.1 hypothetical protein [Acidobacteriota bacterium]